MEQLPAKDDTWNSARLANAPLDVAA